MIAFFFYRKNTNYGCVCQSLHNMSSRAKGLQYYNVSFPEWSDNARMKSPVDCQSKWEHQLRPFGGIVLNYMYQTPAAHCGSAYLLQTVASMLKIKDYVYPKNNDFFWREKNECKNATYKLFFSEFLSAHCQMFLNYSIFICLPVCVCDIYGAAIKS